jgi:rubrerythrin
MATEEAASVHAFEQLRAELSWLRAPAELVVAAASSARDEERHARTITELARSRGAEPALKFVVQPRSSDIESTARHNAVEGCVRETYGALLAHWQATRAEDPELRAAFARIARDETRHAALAWAIARWADTRLPAKGQRRVAHAHRRAVRTLERELGREPHRDLVRQAGLPRAAQARSLLGAMVAPIRRPVRVSANAPGRG